MNSWAPIWSMIVDSSLWDEPYHVRLLFITMLALKDADNIVRYDGYLLGKKAHVTPEECLEAMGVLSSPDTKRQAFECLEKQEFDGRRIEKVDGGWLILNGPKYRSMIQKMKNRGYKTEWQFKKRHEGRKVAVPVAVVDAVLSAVSGIGFTAIELKITCTWFSNDGQFLAVLTAATV